MFCQPAYAATDVWTKAKEIMQDVYTQILAISTIAAIVTASVALLLMNFSRSGRTVDESRAWTGYPAPEAAEFEGFSFSSIYDPPILNDFLMLNREQKNPHLSKQMWAFKWSGVHLGSKKAP